MKNQKVIYLYRAVSSNGFTDIVAVDDPSDDAQICGMDRIELPVCYEGELAWAYTWAEDNGIKLERLEIVVDIPDEGWIGRN
jgi:hypothetical protein